MKPHEQTWEVSADDEVYDPKTRTIVARGPISADDAPLLAAAPELARALLLVEWSFNSCNVCGAFKDEDHVSDCIVRRALEKAGIR